MNKKDLITFAERKGLKLLDDIPEKFDYQQDRFTFVDKYKYKYLLTPSSVGDMRSRHSMVKNVNPYSINNIQQYIWNHGSKTKVLSEQWIDASTKIKFQCDKCGAIYYDIWNHVYTNKKFKCNHCSYNKPPEAKSIKRAKELCKKHGYTLLVDTYKNLKCFNIMDKQGYKYSGCSIYTLNNRTNRYQRFHSNNKYRCENIMLYTQLNDISIEIESINNDNTLDIKCVTCGTIFNINQERIVGKHKQYTCLHCTKSQTTKK